MRTLVQYVKSALLQFEAWFDGRFGWFFTNGMKQDPEERELIAPASEKPRVALPKA